MNKSLESIFHSFHNENIWPILGSKNQYLPVFILSDDLVDVIYISFPERESPIDWKLSNCELYALYPRVVQTLKYENDCFKRLFQADSTS